EPLLPTRLALPREPLAARRTDELDDDDEREGEEEHERPDDVRLRWDPPVRRDVDELREGREGRARVEVRDDEVVEAEREREQPGREDARDEQREGHAPEGRPRRGVQVGRGLLEARVEARDARLDREHDESDAEHEERK